VASNDLNERLIGSLKQQGAAIDVWGVGTMLVTAFDQPALGGVYKLSAIRRADGSWEPKVKVSEQTVKVTTPGILQARRFRNATEFLGDAIYDERSGLTEGVTVVDPIDPLRQKRFEEGIGGEDLLVPVCRDGMIVYKGPALEGPALADIRQRTKAQLAMLHPGIKRFDNPHRYPAGLEIALHELRTELALNSRGRTIPRGLSTDS
jgi:nicotinate phosphoribosyltransferase